MIKTTSSVTTSHVSPVKKATPRKPHIKNKLSRIGEEPRTPSNQSSLAFVSTATMASSMSSSQLTMITSSTQSNSSNLVCALDFTNLPDHTKKKLYLVDFCDPIDVESECLKYLSGARDLPLGQESQLTFLLNNLKLKDIQMADYHYWRCSYYSISSNALNKSKVSERLHMLNLQSQIYDHWYRWDILLVSISKIFIIWIYWWLLCD